MLRPSLKSSLRDVMKKANEKSSQEKFTSSLVYWLCLARVWTKIKKMVKLEGKMTMNGENRRWNDGKIENGKKVKCWKADTLMCSVEMCSGLLYGSSVCTCGFFYFVPLFVPAIYVSLSLLRLSSKTDSKHPKWYEWRSPFDDSLLLVWIKLNKSEFI